MGCNFSKFDHVIAEEEKFIIESENFMDFGKHRSETLLKLFAKPDTNTRRNIQKLFDYLKYAKKDQQKLNAAIKGLGNAILIKNEVDFVRLKTVIVLLCKDKFDTKAKLLFHMYKSKTFMNLQDIEFMLENITNISIQLITGAIYFSSKGFSESRAENYAKKLAKSQKYFIDKISHLILEKENNVSQDVFICKISKITMLKHIVTTIGIRSLLNRLFSDHFLMNPNERINLNEVSPVRQKELRCINNHVLRFHQDSPYFYFKNFGS